MATWTVDFHSAVTVEAEDEEDAIDAAYAEVALLRRNSVPKDPTKGTLNDLEFFDFGGWEE